MFKTLKLVSSKLIQKHAQKIQKLLSAQYMHLFKMQIANIANVY